MPVIRNVYFILYMFVIYNVSHSAPEPKKLPILEISLVIVVAVVIIVVMLVAIGVKLCRQHNNDSEPFKNSPVRLSKIKKLTEDSIRYCLVVM